MEQVMTSINLSAVYPEIILTFCSLALLLMQSFNSRGFKDYYGYVSLIGVLACILVVLSQPDGSSQRVVEYSFTVQLEVGCAETDEIH